MDTILVLFIERSYCCRSSEYYKVEIEEYEFKDKFIEMFKNGIRIELSEGSYENCQFLHNSTKYITISKNEYNSGINKIIDIIC
jgi:hypothetical protein